MLKLNLGSGKDWREDFINADIIARAKPDILLDIQKVPWGETVDTRLGTVNIEPETFDLILANDVLEHLPDLVTSMKNCLSLLKDGGEMHISVPYDLSLGAWQDPTHVRAFNENSWLYYTDWHWYLGWDAWRFYLQDLKFVLSEYGKDLGEAALRTPRAIDSMQVVLRKGAV